MNKIIPEIFEKYQIRKNKKQKTEFINYTTKTVQEMGWNTYIENGIFGSRNIVVGDPNQAKVIFTAHYDTCVKLPFPNFLTPKNIFIYVLFNIAIVLMFLLVIFGIGFGVGIVCGLLKINEQIGKYLAFFIYLALYSLFMFGPANKHTANDNTSGVTVLFGILKNLSEEQRKNVAVVFFDLEELGLIGSNSFATAHKKIKENTLVVNFDCVSDGKDIMILAKKKAWKYSEKLKQAFVSNSDINVQVIDKALYPSDQKNFKIGVGVAAFKKTKSGMLYMDKIHTSKDTVFQRENIDFLIDGAIKLSEIL